jgi:hypothetical protein
MRLCVCGALVGFAAASASGQLFYERATLGATGQTSGGGLSVGNQFYSGWRFEVTSGPVQVQRIGGHFYAGGTTGFGAIVQLTGPNDDPDAFDLTSSDVLGTTLITLPTGSSAEVSAPFSATLQNGWYLVIFGAGAFGAGTFTGGLVAQDPSTAVPGAQLNVSYRQATHPLGQGGPFLQGSVARLFVEYSLGGSTCYANCDASTATPVLNVADFTCFLQRFAAGESYANCDSSTTVPTLNVADFTCFLQQFAAGCP